MISTNLEKKLYPRSFVREDLVALQLEEKHPFSVPRRNKPKFYQSICNSCKWISEGLKCMEPLDRNFAFVFNYGVRKLTKKTREFYTNQWSNIQKKRFFSVPRKKQTQFSLISL